MHACPTSFCKLPSNYGFKEIKGYVLVNNSYFFYDCRYLMKTLRRVREIEGWDIDTEENATFIYDMIIIIDTFIYILL